MKNIICLLFGLGMIFSCSDDTVDTIDLCGDDKAEYTYNDNFFQTKHLPDQGEFLNPDGVSCGIAAVLDEASNIMTLRIFGETQAIHMRFATSTINQQLNFEFIEYTNSSSDAAYNILALDSNNYIQIDLFDSSEQTVQGTFKFIIKNANGEVIDVRNGEFVCSYSKF